MRAPRALAQHEPRAAGRGIALLVVLVLLLVMGLTTGMAMRSALVTQKVGASLRLDSIAQQAAEAALRVCEDELLKDSSQRVPEIGDVEQLAALPMDRLNWSNFNFWKLAPPQAGLVARYAPPGTAPTGAPNPECLVERVSLTNGEVAIVVTARGYSPGFTADAADGHTLSGQVVWLQSFLYFD